LKLVAATLKAGLKKLNPNGAEIKEAAAMDKALPSYARFFCFRYHPGWVSNFAKKS